MNTVIRVPNIVQAAQSDNLLGAALAYAHMGFSVLPLKGKRPNLPRWTEWQTRAAPMRVIERWHQAGLLHNIGLVCGSASGNRVALDLDGAAGYPAFVAMFPHLAETYTVATGGGVGKHIYWQVEELPESVKAMDSPIGNLEMCSQGRQIVAPPSIHPTTGKPYRMEKALPILKVKDLQPVVDWIQAFKIDHRFSSDQHWQPPQLSYPWSNLNPRILQEISRYFLGLQYKQYGDWLHGRCIYPERHKHGDRNASFGFNQISGFGYCYRCGTILAKDICQQIGIHPADYGGLTLAAPRFQIDPDKLSKGFAAIPPDTQSPTSIKEGASESEPPSDNPTLEIGDLKLPNWLKLYLEWAGSKGNQTPLSFHLAAGLWLLSVAVGRRLYGEAPWGINIYPNLYLMLIADTTYYRKSTAYKLAEQIARQAIPHMLMPTPGSPERFQEALSGLMPANFDKLSREQQERLTKAQPFAAQRGLLKDEVAGLFGAMNRKDYMSGMKDLLMELYDCPDYTDKDTQTGLTIVQNAALSLLGVTTPAGLGASVSQADWSNGLLIRFALITPERNYTERQPIPQAKEIPIQLIQGLRTLHEKLPMPQNSEQGLQPPGAMQLKVDCWRECQQYSNHLREQCNPFRESELDDRLKGVYGRMHVQAFKLASLFAALDWVDAKTKEPVPTVTQDHWFAGKAIADLWLASAHRLLDKLDHNGAAQKEQSLQKRIQDSFWRAGATGEKLHTIYKNLHLSARQARQATEELVRAGILIPARIGRAEGYVHHCFAGKLSHTD